MISDLLILNYIKERQVNISRKKKIEKRGGCQILDWTYARRGGGGHSDVYYVQHGGWGGIKIGKNCVRNLWKAPNLRIETGDDGGKG